MQQRQPHALKTDTSISFSDQPSNTTDGTATFEPANGDNVSKKNCLYFLIVNERQDRVLLAPTTHSATSATTCRKTLKWTLPHIHKYNLNPSFFEDVLCEAYKQLRFSDSHFFGLRVLYKRDYMFGTHRSYVYIMMFVWLDNAVHEAPREFDWTQLDSQFFQRYEINLPLPEMSSIVHRELRLIQGSHNLPVSPYASPRPTTAQLSLAPDRNHCETPSHAPWTSWDGFRKIWKWADVELNKLRIGCDRHPLQIRITPESTVWCFPKKENEHKIVTATATVFLKWTHGCANDAGITELLSRHMPDLVRAPLAVDIRKNVMLLEDFGANEIGSNDIVNRKQKSKFMSDLHRLHCISGDLIEELLSVGLPLLSVAWQRAHLSDLINAPEAAHVYNMEEYQDIDLAVVHQTLVDRLLKLEETGNAVGCDERDSSHALLPRNCLVHLDYDLGNLILSHQPLKNESKSALRIQDDDEGNSAQVRIFDFGSAVCTHPAFDLIRCDQDAIAQYCGGHDQPIFTTLLEQVELANNLSYLFDAFRFLSRSRRVGESDARQICVDMFRCHLMDVLDSL